ncbi:LysM peptidoglycan-binding domain-containing protein [Neobacillus sp. NPDC058068]|uniref:LysM peptidoglycan-binding domain-containing protein n=1 Tax=Neobacillus sp. NPDC058068 TaxID=3346325 RepID=UPI0036D8B613
MSKRSFMVLIGFFLFGLFLIGPTISLAESNLQVNVDLKQTITTDTVSNGNYLRTAVDKNTIYIPDKQATMITALDAETKSIKWKFSTSDGEEIRQITLQNGLIVFSTANKTFAIKDIGKEAALQWTLNYSGYSFSSDSSNLYFVSNKNIVAVNLTTGIQKWTFSVSQREGIQSNIAVGNGKLYFVTDNQIDMVRKMYALDTATSQVLWTTNTVDYYSTKLVIKDGKIYTNWYADLYVYDANKGTVLGKTAVTTNFMFEVNANTVFAKANDGYLYAYDKETRVLRWKTLYADRVDGARLVNTSSGPIVVTQNYVLIENNGKVKWYDVNTGSLVRELIIPGLPHQPVMATENFLLTSGYGNLYVYMPATDTIKPNAFLDTVSKRFSPYEGSQAASLSFNLSKDAYVKVHVKNESGKVVRVLDYGLLNQGWNYKNWDGKDQSGVEVSTGFYTFVFQLKDLAGNEQWLEDPAKRTMVGDIFGTTIKETTVKKAASLNAGQMSIIPAETKVTILDESGDWYQVSFWQNSLEYNGWVLKSELFTRSIPQPVVPPVNNSIVHTVQSGDTLWKIAQKYGTTIQEIVDANQLDINKPLNIGQKLMIPGKAAETTPAVVHTVQSGDTLWKIAQKYGTTIQTIVDLNKLDPNKPLYIGQKLTISDSTPGTDLVIHIVQSGDTLWKIAQKYGTTVDAITKANNLDPAKYLEIGQKLTIPR